MCFSRKRRTLVSSISLVISAIGTVTASQARKSRTRKWLAGAMGAMVAASKYSARRIAKRLSISVCSRSSLLTTSTGVREAVKAVRIDFTSGEAKTET